MTGHLYLAPSGAERAPSAGSAPIRIVLADDHSLVRRSLRVLLDGEPGLDVVAEASDLATAAQHVHRQAPHVLVLDLQMPGGSSLDLIRRLRERVPETEIVVLTMERSPVFAEQAMLAGALGFVAKDRADAELPLAVRRAARGEEFVSAQVAAALEGLRMTVNGDALSPRETEVLRLTALGYTASEIATRLHVSRRTVDTHRANLHHKLGVHTRAELVDLALRRHLIGA